MAIHTLTSPTDLNVPTRSTLILLTKDSFVSLDTYLSDKNNVCKTYGLLFTKYDQMTPSRQGICPFICITEEYVFLEGSIILSGALS